MKPADYHLARRAMVENQLARRGVKDPRLLEVMAEAPRHMFVEEALASQAYADHPLPIGEQQTISQPYIVAQMTEALALKGDETVLEIGTGSGYQTYILARLSYRVFTVERLRPLMTRARQTLEGLDVHNVRYRLFDGTLGWEEEGPFDAIIVTAGAPELPQPLINQLAEGGRLVIPVGQTRISQTLYRYTKKPGGTVLKETLGGCRFVDLVGEHGWPEG